MARLGLVEVPVVRRRPGEYLDETGPGADPKGAPRVAVLEQTLWDHVREETPLETFCESWLALQCRMVPGVKRGFVLLDEPGGQTKGSPQSVWPDGETPSESLLTAATLAMEQVRGITQGQKTATKGGRLSNVSYPLVIAERVRGVVALEVEGNARSLMNVMRQLQWGAGALRDRLRKDDEDAERRIVERTTLALDMVAIALEEQGFLATCRSAVTELAARIDCERVSLGFVRRGHASVSAISHSAQFGKHMALVRALGAAMDEAIDQRALVLFPDACDDPIADRSHRELARNHGLGAALTVPLMVGDQYVGALVCERPVESPFDREAIELIECIAAALGPILEEKRQNDRWIVFKIADAAEGQIIRLLGPGHLGRKLATAVALVVFGFFWFATDTYRVTADAVVEGLVQREIVAPFDGYIKAAPARAGDTVQKGAVLAALDDRDLALERLRWVTERQQLLHQYERALGERNRAETNIVKAQIDQTQAQIGLIDAQLARMTLHAPFDGLVVSGDLSQSIGAAARRGDVLFKLAPLQAYRVVLEVAESQISEIERGQRGQLLAVSVPAYPFPFFVERITPVAVTREGRNVFRIEARLEGTPKRLRPGMEGVGKVSIDERRLIWIWTRPLLEWFRLFSWEWAG